MILPILILTLSLINLSHQIGFIRPLEPFQAVFVNTKLPSIYNLAFTLDSGLRSDNFIRLKFANYTTVTNPTCLFSVNTPLPTTKTICTASDNSVYIAPGVALTSTDKIYATIFVNEVIPDTPGHTELFELSTTSTTDPSSAIIFDMNPGFGQFVWESYANTGHMFLELLNLGTPGTRYLQGASNDATFHIRFSKKFTARYSRVVVVIDFPWKFGSPVITTAQSPLYSLAVSQGQPTYLYEPAVIASYSKINDNIIEIFFDETFDVGREFVLSITDIINPIVIGSGKIRFYSTEYKSNYVLERNELTELSTAQNNLPITISLASGLPFTGPVGLYQNTEQYITISFVVDATIPSGSVIIYEFPTGNTPIPGTLYISSAMPPLTSDGVKFSYGTNNITFSNIDTLTVGSTVYIQVKVLFSRISPDFTTSITIKLDSTTLKFGTSTPIVLKTNAKSIVSYIQGTSGENGVINIDGNQINIGLSPRTRDTTTGSSLKIYGSKFITAGTPTCTSSAGVGTLSPCTVATTTYTLITLNSETGQNAFPSTGLIALTISDLTLSKVSNHETAIYEFYGILDYDGTGTQYKEFMVFAFVRPQRSVLSNFLQYHIGDFRLNTNANYPSFIRVTGLSTTLNAITLTATEKLILTIYGQVSLSNFLQVTDQGTFPCASNLAISCQYIQGNPTTLATNPLDWNRVIITLPNTALSSDFNIYIPQFFTTGLHSYEFMVGKFDTTTRTYENLYLSALYTFTPLKDLVFLTSTDPDSNLKLDLTGAFAGILAPNDVPIIFSTPGGYLANSGSNIGATTILITSWNFWSSSSSVTNLGTPISTDPQDSIVFLSYETTTGYKLHAILFPMIGTATTPVTFLLHNVYMPYSLDTPDHIIYVTDRTGNIVSYNQFINGGRNALSVNTMNQLGFNCTHMIRGYLNTYCTLSFTPNADIDLETKVKFNFEDAYITISGCTVKYTTGGVTTTLSSNEFDCQANLREIRLSFKLASRLPAGARFDFSFYGLDHGNSPTQSVSFSIFDADFGYLIEQGTFPYYLEVINNDFMIIDNIDYDFQNLDSISNLQLDFTLPRDMFPNEILEVDVGSDIQGNNKNTDRLALVLYNIGTSSRINIVGALKNQVLVLIIEQGLLLPQGSYSLRVDNIRTPATHSTDEIQIRLRRSTDNVFVLTQKKGAYTPYPVLKFGSSTNISLSSYRYFCVGCLGEITLSVTPMVSYIDADTVFYIHFPSYFLPALSNDPNKIECRLDNDPIVCDTDSAYPFRLRLIDPPTLFSPGDTFTITIYGFVVPNRERAVASAEDLFFAIDTLSNKMYSEQTFLKLPDLIAPSDKIGSLYLRQVTTTNLYVKETNDHTLTVLTSVLIPQTYIVTVTFVSEYINLPYIPSLECSMSYQLLGVTTNDVSSESCEIIGKTVKFTIVADIPAASLIKMIIKAVPNPSKATTVDPNEFIIGAFKPDENSVIALSTKSLNSASNITYIDPPNTLTANGGNDLILTRGTYSDLITIGTLDGSRFQQDVVITASINGFKFIPSVIDFFVGDISNTFKVGCDKNVKARTYPLNFSQSQDESLTNLYGDLFNIRIIVTDNPITITIPSTIYVIRGGTSLPIPITLVNPPYSDLQILIVFNEAFFNGAFRIDADYSSPALNFTVNQRTQYLAFVATTKLAISSFTISLELDGSNYESYRLSTDTVEIIVIDKNLPTPFISGSQTGLGKTYASFQLNYPEAGVAIVQVNANCMKPLTIDIVKNMLRNSSYNTIETTTGCWQRYFLIILDSPGVPYSLQIVSLKPETRYKAYIYYENQKKGNNQNDPLTFDFTTKGIITFTFTYH